MFNLRRQGRGAVWKTGLRLQGGREYLSLPRGRALDLPLHERRGRQDPAPLLDVSLSQLSDEGQMYPKQTAPGVALGARSRSGRRPGPAGPEARYHDGAAQHGRARLRNPQVLDGLSALPDEKAAQCENGDVAPRPVL